MRRALTLGLAVVVALPLLAACSRDSVRPGEARLDPDGVVELARPGADYKLVSGSKTIRNGDRVRVQSGTADVRLPDAELALRAGSELVVGSSPELIVGDLLVVPKNSLTVRSAGSEFGVDGAARLSRRYAVSAASYQGGVSVRSAGASLAIPALRQASVAALGEVPQRAEPLQYAPNDSWDRRFLADAIDLGLELQARADGANAQFRGQGTTPGFYRTLMPQLGDVPEFNSSLLDAARPPGEHIVGAGISLAARDGRFAERWHRAFAFRGEGATWGLVALDQQVHRVPGLVKSIDEALGRSRLPGDDRRVVASASPRPAPSSNGDRGTTTTTRPGGRTTSTTTTSTTTPTTPTTQPGLIPSPPDTGLPIDPVVDDTVDTINGLLPPRP